MNNRNTALDLVGCPACEAPAEVVDRFVLTSTDGPVEHVKVHCLNRHWHTAAAETLPTVPAGRAEAIVKAREAGFGRHL